MPTVSIHRAADQALCAVPAIDNSHALDHVVVVLFENRSLDNVLRHLYGPEDGKERDASARTSDHLFSLSVPRNPRSWATITARPVPEWTLDVEVVGKGLSTLVKGMGPALIARARDLGVQVPAELDKLEAKLNSSLVVPLLRQIAAHSFPLLAPDAE
jgi:hypothetical protein